jgi:hypothetical protein
MFRTATQPCPTAFPEMNTAEADIATDAMILGRFFNMAYNGLRLEIVNAFTE